MMSLLENGPSVISFLFRFSSLIFLRIAPYPIFGKLVVTTYALYLTSSIFLTKRSEQKVEGEDDVKREDSAIVQEPVSRESFLSSLFFLSPSSGRRLFVVDLVINTLLLLASVDFVLHPHFDRALDIKFTRIGAVNSDAAKILVRYPNELLNATQHDIQVVWRQVKSNVDSANPWRNGPLLHLNHVDDWVGRAKLTGLWPSTDYEYKLAHTNKTHLPYPASPITFKTSPDPRLMGTHFKFVTSSSITPNYPYVPFSKKIKGLDLLAESLWPSKTTHSATNATKNATVTTPATPTPFPASFLLFLGNFIYADLPFPIRDDVEEYRHLYRRNYATESFRKVYEKLPILYAYDDHEFVDEHGADVTSPFANASSAWNSYAGSTNHDGPHAGENYYDFRHGDVAFFVLDTHRYRTDIKNENITAHTILGDKQLGALYHWLVKANVTAAFKFLISPVPLTELWGSASSWSSYGPEREALLSVVHTIPNFIVITGSRHEAAIVEYLPPTADQWPILEVSVSPLSQMSSPTRGWTLRDRGSENIKRVKAESQVADDGKEVTVSIDEELPRERLLKGLACGSYKWATFEVDTRDREKPVVKLEVWEGGKERYSLHIPGSPVKISYTMALGAFVPGGFMELLDKIGMKPSKWF